MYAIGRRLADSRDTLRDILTDEPCLVRYGDCRRQDIGDRNNVVYATGRRLDDSRGTFRNMFTDEPCPVRC